MANNAGGNCRPRAPTPLVTCILILCISTSNLLTAAGARVRHYRWEVSQQYKSPDCSKKLAMVVNGQTPGPTIGAQQGDIVIVEVKNSLHGENTAIHFHRIRQLKGYLYHHYGNEVWVLMHEKYIFNIFRHPYVPAVITTAPLLGWVVTLVLFFHLARYKDTHRGTTDLRLRVPVTIQGRVEDSLQMKFFLVLLIIIFLIILSPF